MQWHLHEGEEVIVAAEDGNIRLKSREHNVLMTIAGAHELATQIRANRVIAADALTVADLLDQVALAIETPTGRA